MSYLLKRIIDNKSARILFYFYLLIILLSGFFIVSNYFKQKEQTAETVYATLQPIVNITSSQISSKKLDWLLTTFPQKDDLKEITDDSLYLSLNMMMHDIAETQALKSPMYLLRYNKEKDVFEYIVRSDAKVYYLHEYRKYPPELKKKYGKRGKIPVYTTENGTWLSAFSPIRAEDGRILAIVEADINVDSYFEEVRSNFRQSLLISGIGVLFITLLLLPIIRKILRRDEQNTLEILEQKQLIEDYSKEVQASVRYASSLQKAIAKPFSHLEFFSFFDMLYEPRDIVSGDFRWSTETENFFYLAVGDCTGHGVPGAMLSVIGSTMLNNLFKSGEDLTPGEILEEFDREFTSYINSSVDNLRMDGMDISLIRICKKDKKVIYSGAFIDLVYFTNGEMNFIRSNRYPIGGADAYPKTGFTDHELILEGKTTFFLFSDGFQDQFGGERDKKLGRKRFMEWLTESLNEPNKKRMSFIEKKMAQHQGLGFQVDDRILVVLEIN